ncbi:winged helix-turn-helix domain-containing protein [Brevundimonas sp. 2R-24]|uniref:Winged helix-turn-helix domain-containing protein n=1 Tax=Peiella sedimenti TaxID=3061083 RepID=A0ABT8SKL5_9CAUL|nr:winged helix-turn-helix domain-containing protein [Caulobacteraceae bacterium XZ-24]
MRGTQFGDAEAGELVVYCASAAATPHLDELLAMARAAGLRPDVRSSSRAMDGARAVLAIMPDLSPHQIVHLVNLCNGRPLAVLSPSDEEVDRVIALELGIDDVLSWRQSRRELVARLRALLRRAPPAEAAAGSAWRIDWRRGVLTGPTGLTIRLTAQEMQLLRVLQSADGEPVPQSALSEALSASSGADRRSAATLISRFRRKLGDADSPLIGTAYGQGYYLAAKLHQEGDGL